MSEYQLNPYSLAKKLGLSSTSIRQVIVGKSGVTASTALRLSKFFGQPPAFWLDLQVQADLQAAAKNTELQQVLKGIAKASKPTSPARTKSNPDKKPTLSDKRKKAAKAPGSKASLKKATVKKPAVKEPEEKTISIE